MAELGTYYIDIVPSTKGLGGKIEKAMGDEAESSGKKSGLGFVKNFGSAISEGASGLMSSFGSAISNLTSQFLSGAKEVTAYGDNVDKMSQKIGISADSYQKWSYVMERAGTSVDNLKMGMKTLSSQAQTNSDAFKALGISEAQLKSLSQEDLFQEVIKGLSSMEEGSERTALATQLLGRAGVDLGPLLNEGTEAIEEQMEMAEKYGMVMSDETVAASAAFADSMTTLQGTMTGLKNRMIGQFLPALTTVTDGLALLFTGDTSGLDGMVAGIQELGDQVMEMIPTVLEVAGPLIEGLASGIIEHIPDLFDTAVQVIGSFGGFIMESLPQLAEAAVQVITAFANDIGTQLPTLIPAAVEAVTTIVNGLIANIPQLIPAALQLIVGLGTGLIQAIPTLLSNIPTIITSLVNGLIGQIPAIKDAGIDLLSSLVDGLDTIISMVTAPIGEIISSLVDGFMQGVSDMMNVGKNLVEGIWNGISDMAGWIGEKIKGFGSGVLDGLKNFFGIASPSKLFHDQIGKNLVLGLVDGITDNEGLVTDAMNELADLTTGTLDANLAIPSGNGLPFRSGASIGDITLNVYPSEGMDEEALAQRTVDMIVQQIQKEELVWA